MRSRSASRSQVVRNRYSAIDWNLRGGAPSGSVAGRRLAVPELGGGPFHDLGEADHGDGVLIGDRPGVDLGEEVHGRLAAAELRVVVLDVAGGELGDLLHLDIVDDGGEDLLPRLVAIADRNPDDLAALVLARLVAQPDRGRLPAAPQLVDEDGRVEVEHVERGVHGASLLIHTY